MPPFDAYDFPKRAVQGPMVLNRVTVNAVVSNTAVETPIYTFTLPRGTLRKAERLRLQMLCTVADTTTDITAAVRTVTLRCTYGATTLGTITFNTQKGDGATNQGMLGAVEYLLSVLLAGAGAPTAQEAQFIAQGNPWVLTNDGLTRLGGSFVSGGQSAEENTVPKALSVTVQWSNADASKVVTMKNALLELL